MAYEKSSNLREMLIIKVHGERCRNEEKNQISIAQILSLHRWLVASNSIIVSGVHCTTTETMTRLLVNREREEKVVHNSLLAPKLSKQCKKCDQRTITVYSAVLPSSLMLFCCLPVEWTPALVINIVVVSLFDVQSSDGN